MVIKMKKLFIILTCLFILFYITNSLAYESHAHESDYHYDYAKIINVTPEYEQKHSLAPTCHITQPDSSVNTNLITDIENLEQIWKKNQACYQARRERQTMSEIVGYHVTYLYKGQEGESFVRKKPGQYLLMKVEIYPVIKEY